MKREGADLLSVAIIQNPYYRKHLVNDNKDNTKCDKSSLREIAMKYKAIPLLIPFMEYGVSFLLE